MVLKNPPLKGGFFFILTLTIFTVQLLHTKQTNVIMSYIFDFISNSIPKSTFNQLTLGWIAIAIVLFPVLLKINPPYGRYSNSSWGPMVNNKMAWFFMEIPAIIIILWFFWNTTNYENKIVLSAFLLWIIHYFNRAFIFPLRLRTKSKKMPLAILLFGAFFNLVNAGLNGYWLAFIAPAHSADLLSSPRFIIGIDIFIVGFLINQFHDTILIHLRRFNTGYKIPTGGLFKYISCPNYFGEIVQWIGFAIICWSLPSLAFCVWTIVNLVPRALNHQKWYREKFEHYPKSRKAIIPFIL